MDRWDLPTRWPMSAAPATGGLADLSSWRASAVPAARDRWDLPMKWPMSAAPATKGLADLRSWRASAIPAARDRWDLVTSSSGPSGSPRADRSLAGPPLGAAGVVYWPTAVGRVGRRASARRRPGTSTSPYARDPRPAARVPPSVP